LFENTLFCPDYKAPFYRFVSDPVSDPDSNPDRKCLFRIRIGSGSRQKFLILPDPDPQHWITEHREKKLIKLSLKAPRLPDPLRDGTVLFHLLGENPLDAESLEGRHLALKNVKYFLNIYWGV